MEYTALPGMTIAEAMPEERAAYLRKVLGLTVLGLLLSALVGMASMFAIASNPAMLSGYGPMIIILGCWALTNFVARPMVFGQAKWGGFLLGTVAQGISLGFLLLMAVIISKADTGNPFTLIGTALVATIFTGVGLAFYAASEKREFSLLRAGLSAMFIPMLILMAVSFAFPNLLNGPLGIAASGLFVLISAAGLLYQLNAVIHSFTPEMEMEGAYIITIGVLVLFWNILSLLMRLRRR